MGEKKRRQKVNWGDYEKGEGVGGHFIYAC